MDINILTLIVSLARLLEIRPEKLAEAFNNKNENQAYYDLVLEAEKRNTKLS